MEVAVHDALLSSSALQLARAIREGSLSARAVVDAHIARTTQVNRAINAVAAERFADARAEADEVDRRRMLGEALPPLAGVPFSLKEMIDLAGWPCTFGSLQRRDRRALSDATVVQRLRAAGAIPIVSTNVPEWGMWYETANLVYGRTNNPHRLSHTTGGSSGGEAALVAARGSVFGLGSDIGGSVRIPAAFCGVFGHKPSSGLIPLTGHYPVYRDGPDAALAKNNGWLTIGPLTRSAHDLMPLLQIMAGADPVDPNSRELPLGTPPSDWQRRKVFVLEDPRIKLAGRARSEMRAAVQSAASALQQRGAIIEHFDARFFCNGVLTWFAALQSLGSASMQTMLAGERGFSILGELLRHMVRRPRFSIPAVGFCAVESLCRFSPAKLQAMLEQLSETRAAYDRLLEDAVLILPPHPRPAPRHHVALLHPFGYAFTAIFNSLQAPVTTVPVSLTDAGLPVGVQIASAFGNDHLTIGAALVLEESLGGAPWANITRRKPQPKSPPENREARRQPLSV